MENTTRLEMKILALKEGFRSRVASLSDDYEDKIAELRIELTEQSNELNEVRNQLAEAQAELASLKETDV